MVCGISTAFLSERIPGDLVTVCSAFLRQRFRAAAILAAGCIGVYPSNAFL
jgi:hypothetical protein